MEELNRKYAHSAERLKGAREEGEQKLQELHKEFEQAFKESRIKVDHLERDLAKTMVSAVCAYDGSY